MPERRSDTALPLVIERHDGTVIQRQLDAASRLLLRHAARHRTVDLVGQPVLGGHRFELQYIFDVMYQFSGIVLRFRIALPYGTVVQHRARRLAEHILQFQVDRLLARFVVDKSKLHVARRLADHIERRTFTLGNAAQFVDILLFDDESHALLRLVADDLLRAEGRIADRQVLHVDPPAGRLDQLAETVQVTARTVVVNRNNRVFSLLRSGPDRIVGSFLHFGVRTLHGIQFDRTGILARGHRRNGTAAHTDAVVVTAQQHHFVARLRFVLDTVLLTAITDTASLHDHLVEAELLPVFEMLERLHTTADKRLAELVTEIRSPVRGFDQDILRSLVQPFARSGELLPLAPAVQPRIGSHVNGRPGHRERALTAGDAVADLAARTGCRAVERLDGGREIVRLGFDRNHALEILDAIVIRRIRRRGGELLHHGTLQESAVIFISRYDTTRVGLCRLFNQAEEGRRHLFAVDDEQAVENLVPAMFRIDLRKAEHLAVGQLAADPPRKFVQVGHLLIAQRQPFLLVVCSNVIDVNNRIGLLADREDILIDRTIHTAQHRVVRCVFALDHLEFLDTGNPLESHVLCDLDGIRTPGGDHLAARSDKNTVEHLGVQLLRFAEKPSQFGDICCRERLAGIDGINDVCFPEKEYHS